MKQDGFFEPPAQVQQAESFTTLMNEVGTLEKQIAHDDRMSLDRAIRQGTLLIRAYEMRVEGQWQAELSRIGVPQQRASERMKVARLPAPVVAQCSSIAQALKACADISKGSGKVVRKKKPKKKKPQPCDRCFRLGGPACPTCWENFPEGFPQREPGDDDPDDEPADTLQDGVIVYDIKKVEQNAFAPARREITKFTKLYGLTEESPELKRLRAAHAAYKEAWLQAISAVTRKLP